MPPNCLPSFLCLNGDHTVKHVSGNYLWIIPKILSGYHCWAVGFSLATQPRGLEEGCYLQEMGYWRSSLTAAHPYHIGHYVASLSRKQTRLGKWYHLQAVKRAGRNALIGSELLFTKQCSGLIHSTDTQGHWPCAGPQIKHSEESLWAVKGMSQLPAKERANVVHGTLLHRLLMYWPL